MSIRMLIITMLTILSFSLDAKMYSYDASNKDHPLGNTDTESGWHYALKTYVNPNFRYWEIEDILRIEGKNGIAGIMIMANPGNWGWAKWEQIQKAMNEGAIIHITDRSGGTNDNIECLLPVPECQEQTEPLMIDLGQDGFHLGKAGAGIYYDFENSGIYRPVQWVSRGGNEAFLALDKNNNGQIDNGAELFGRGILLQSGLKASHGFEELAQYDELMLGGNNDGVIDSQDSIWSSLSLWLDSNADGNSTHDELSLLADSDITALNLDAKENGRRDHAGNLLRFWSWATSSKTEKNNKFRMIDVYFKPLGKPMEINNHP